MVSLLYAWANLVALPWALAVQPSNGDVDYFQYSESPLFGETKDAQPVLPVPSEPYLDGPGPAHPLSWNSPGSNWLQPSGTLVEHNQAPAKKYSLEDLEELLAEEPYGNGYDLDDPQFQATLQQILGWFSRSQTPPAQLQPNAANGQNAGLSGSSEHTQQLGESNGSRYLQACLKKMQTTAEFIQNSGKRPAPAPYDAKHNDSYWKSKAISYSKWIVQRGQSSLAKLLTPQHLGPYDMEQVINALNLGDAIAAVEYNANSETFNVLPFYDPISQSTEQCTQGARLIDEPHTLFNFLYIPISYYSDEMFGEGLASFPGHFRMALESQYAKDSSLDWLWQLLSRPQ